MVRRIAAMMALSAALFLQIAPARAATLFDGVYHGGATVGGGGRCPPGSSFTIRVIDGHFNVNESGDKVAVTVGPDGSFSSQLARRSIQGKIEGSRMTAQVTGAACNYTWALNR